MKLDYLSALRLGFSTEFASEINKKGIKKFVSQQLKHPQPLAMPDFLENSPKSLNDLQRINQKTKNDAEARKQFALQNFKDNLQWKITILKRIFESPTPLREKLNLFFQNHFVSTLQSVRVPYWIFLQYQSIHTHATGNYKTLVKEMVYTNALIKYLDNQQNRRGKINENLARELLELFTLGEGHYTENDIKNAAKALAGLGFGTKRGQYRPLFKDNSQKVFMGKSGNFSADDIIDIIFEQKQTAYFLSEKLLKWFFNDHPDNDSIRYYGDELWRQNFELGPFLEKMMIEECLKQKAGTQIKNPLVFIIQIFKDLELKPHYPLMVLFLKNQSMDLFDQINVKGWKGGQDWLSAEGYSQRIQMIDFLINDNPKFAQSFNASLKRFGAEPLDFNPSIFVQNTKNAYEILNELTSRMVFKTNDEMWEDLNQILKYDFDSRAENAAEHVLKVYNYLSKSPEFQLI